MEWNNIPEVKPGLIAVSRDCFPIALSEKRRAAVRAAYEGELYVSRETRYTAVKVHGIHIHSLEMERFRSLPLSTSYSAILKFLKQTQNEAPSGLGRNSTCSLIMVSLR